MTKTPEIRGGHPSSIQFSKNQQTHVKKLHCGEGKMYLKRSEAQGKE
jgi:hypothetical protein